MLLWSQAGVQTVVECHPLNYRIVIMQEIIDHKILTCRRIINCECTQYPWLLIRGHVADNVLLYIAMMSSFPVAILNTVDYIDPTGRCVFRTTAGERHKVVFQMVCVRHYIN